MVLILKIVFDTFCDAWSEVHLCQGLRILDKICDKSSILKVFDKTIGRKIYRTQWHHRVRWTRLGPMIPMIPCLWKFDKWVKSYKQTVTLPCSSNARAHTRTQMWLNLKRHIVISASIIKICISNTVKMCRNWNIWLACWLMVCAPKIFSKGPLCSWWKHLVWSPETNS